MTRNDVLTAVENMGTEHGPTDYPLSPNVIRTMLLGRWSITDEELGAAYQAGQDVRSKLDAKGIKPA